jgi:hypothetical protein
VQTARTKANGSYDKLAEHGKKALNGQPAAAQSRSRGTTQSRSATAQSSRELNGKPEGKASSSRTGTGS